MYEISNSIKDSKLARQDNTNNIAFIYKFKSYYRPAYATRITVICRQYHIIKHPVLPYLVDENKRGFSNNS